MPSRKRNPDRPDSHRKLPGWKKNPQVSPFKPSGEQAGIRLTVWLLAKSPMHLKLAILWVYRALGKIT